LNNHGFLQSSLHMIKKSLLFFFWKKCLYLTFLSWWPNQLLCSLNIYIYIYIYTNGRFLGSWFNGLEVSFAWNPLNHETLFISCHLRFHVQFIFTSIAWFLGFSSLCKMNLHLHNHFSFNHTFFNFDDNGLLRLLCKEAPKIQQN